MNRFIYEFLASEHITVNEDAMQRIRTAGMWYRGDLTSDHQRETVNGVSYKLLRMGFGKRASADDANLCEVLNINAGDGNDAQSEALQELLDQNQFHVKYREQLERCAAQGTVAAFWRVEGADLYTDGTLRGGKLRLNYVTAEGFIPITVINGDVLEAAFVGNGTHNGKKVATCVICTFHRPDAQEDEVGSFGTGARRIVDDVQPNYEYRSVLFDEDGHMIADERVTLGTVKPFAVMRVAAVNNIPDMDGYGMPKLLQAVPVLLGLDKTFSVLMSDIDDADKLVLINELLCGFDKEGKPITPNEQAKRRFVFLGEKLPEQSSLVHEVVPTIRVTQLAETVELLLSLLSMSFGYGTRKYTFENGQVQTATQYIGERQDMLQELNRQRCEARDYITGIARAGLWFLNAFSGTKWDVDAEVLVEFDDSYVTDRKSELEDVRNDVLAGIGGQNVVMLYLMKRYNLTEEEAREWMGSPVDESEPFEE